MKKIISKNNKNLLEKLIPERGSAFEYEKGMKFTDSLDMAFEHPFECSLPHIKSKENEEDNHLFI